MGECNRHEAAAGPKLEPESRTSDRDDRTGPSRTTMIGEGMLPMASRDITAHLFTKTTAGPGLAFEEFGSTVLPFLAGVLLLAYLG